MRAEDSQQSSAMPNIAKSNVEAIMQIEQTALRQRSRVDRLGKTISALAGSISFAIGNVLVFVLWMVVNANIIPGVAPFDPHPFGLLALLVAMEAILLTTFVLISQNRQTRQAEHWAHMDLQIGLLAEQETTKILQMLRAISSRLGLDQHVGDGELDEMAGKLSVGDLAEHLADHLERIRDPNQSA